MDDPNQPGAKPDQYELMALLNRALIAQSAVDSEKEALAREEAGLALALTDLEKAMQAAQVTDLGGALGKAAFGKRVVYNCADWNVLQKHIRDTGEFDIVQRRLSSVACRDRDSNGELPPGVRRVELKELKLEIAK